MSNLRFREAITSIPPYTPAKSLAEIKRQFGIERIVRLAANENNMGFSPRVQAAIAAALPDIYLYPDGASSQLRLKLAEVLQLQPEQLIMGSGSFELLSLIAQVLIEPGDEAIIPTPSFGWYQTVTQAMGGKVVAVPLRNHAIDLEQIKSEITDKTKLIWLCNPNNPTGTFYTAQALTEFLRRVPDHIAVVSDEAYFDYVEASDYPDTSRLLTEFPNLISLRTFSKVYGLAGLRVGYGIADAEFIGILNRIRLPLNVNSLAQAAAIACLDDPAFRAAVLANNHQGKVEFYQAFGSLGLEYLPTETNFIMVNVARDSVAVFEALLSKGLAVRAGVEFGMPSWLRITIGRPEENRLLIEELQGILKSSEG